MHAFLIIGNPTGNPASLLPAGLRGARILEFPLKKIEDVRSLNNLIRLSFSEPTLIVCENIHEATEEALNAFLKNLEEPQTNIYFALTAPSTAKVLPTIVSRCQVIKSPIINNQISNKEEIIKFLNSKLEDRIAYTDQIKDRTEAIEFIENIITYFHNKIHNSSVKVENVENAIKTLTALRANGNVNLQLTNFVISLV